MSKLALVDSPLGFPQTSDDNYCKSFLDIIHILLTYSPTRHQSIRFTLRNNTQSLDVVCGYLV
jgi:hypothetical protein